MTTTRSDRDPIIATEAEQETLATIQRLLVVRHPNSPRLVGPDGSETPLPESLSAVLLRAVHELGRGNGVAIVPVGRELTTQQAAGLLNVSRPYLISLLESGQIPFHKVGTHRRVRLEDLLAYRRGRDDARRAALTRLSRDAQDLGLYEPSSRPCEPSLVLTAQPTSWPSAKAISQPEGRCRER